MVAVLSVTTATFAIIALSFHNQKIISRLGIDASLMYIDNPQFNGKLHLLKYEICYCDHFVGVRSQRWARRTVWSVAGSGPASLAARLPSTWRSLRIPGMIVLTTGLLRMKRKAISGMVVPGGSRGLRRSACSTLAFRFSGTKYVLRQSPCGHLLSRVNVPVRLPSSKGTRAITATSISWQAADSSSSGFWSKML